MNMRQLECLVAVVDAGSFTRGARSLGITQPSLSQHIRSLEQEASGAGNARSRRRGRKSMDETERRVVAERMRRYWARQREARRVTGADTSPTEAPKPGV